MSTVSSITSSASQATGTSASDGLSSLTGEDFMNLLIQQLSNQDPLTPMSNEEMLNQISTIRQVEMNTRLTERLEQLTEQQRFGASAELIGKQVKGTVTDEDDNEYTKEGVVTSVVYGADGEITLELDNGESVPLSSLEEVTEPTSKTAGSSSLKLVNAA